MVPRTFITAFVLLGISSVALSSPAKPATSQKQTKIALPIRFSHPCQCCVCFALDESGSISDQEWADQINFVNSLAQFHNLFNLLRARYSAVAFESSPASTLIQGLTSSYPIFANALNSYSRNKYGGTNIGAGLGHCQKILSNKWCTAKTIVLLSDGYGSFDQTAVNAIKATGTSIISVGVGSPINSVNLKNIASDPSCVFNAPASTLKFLPRVPIGGVTAPSVCSNPLVVKITSKFCRKRLPIIWTRPPTLTIRTDIVSKS